MNVTRRKQSLIVDDGLGARCGMGVLVPAILAFAFFAIVLPRVGGYARLELAALMFFAVALALAVLRAPRKTEFDVERREVRLDVGWPPLLGYRRTIAFTDISDAKVWQPIRLSDDFGAARPALMVRPGKTVLLSTYNRSPKFCRTIVTQVQQALSAGVTNSRDGKR